MRGVVDFREHFLLLQLRGVFLYLNVFRVDRVRSVAENWTGLHFVLILVLANLCVGNLWLAYLSGLRVDLTKDNIYSVSDVTKDIFNKRQSRCSSEAILVQKLIPFCRHLCLEFETY